MIVGSSAYLLVAAVALVGILHTMVPDHWAPIALLARQRGWNNAQIARAAAIAGVGHTVSTLLIAVIVWLAGVALAVHYGRLLGTLSSLALIGFGGWIAAGSLIEIRRRGAHGDGTHGHAHVHRHGDVEHRHWHDHDREQLHGVNGDDETMPPHDHVHEASSRTALLLILGSSPMIEGIPAFFAAGRYGTGQLVLMAAVFAACTIGTYVVMSLSSARGMQQLDLGPLERYGEVLSGGIIALLGAAFLIFPEL